MVIREYCLQSTLLGLHFVAEKELHWTERIFWLICVLACWCGSVYLMLITLQFYQQNPTTLSEDTNYLNWGTKVPAIIVCESHSKKLDDEVARLFTDKTTIHKKKSNLEQLTFFSGRLSENRIYYYPGNMSYYKTLRSSCEEIFNYCSVANGSLECCKTFLPIETVSGTCFAYNSVHANRSAQIVRLYIGRQHAEMTLEFLNPNVLIYAISPDELPTYKTTAVVKSIPNYAYRVMLKVGELENGLSVRDLDIHQRGCRFIDENNLEVSKLYSFESCRLQCQKRVHMSLYNCTHHYMPYAEPHEICNETQLIQLSKEYKIWTNEQKFQCDCDLSCYGYDVTVLGVLKYKIADKRIKNDSLSQVRITAAVEYTKRIRRRARDALDVIVSLGGTAGLFVGASLLSIFELIYFFTIRPINNKLMTEKEKKQKKRATFLPYVN